MLEIGTKAPAFSLPDQNGQIHTLEEYKGKKVELRKLKIGKRGTKGVKVRR